MKFEVNFVIGIIASLLHLGNGYTLTNAKQIYTDVFTNLKKEVLPSSDQSKPLDISVSFYLLTITRFNEIDEAIVLIAGLALTWNDGGISWDPSLYGNQHAIIVSQKDIWTPPVVLLNAADVLQPIEGDTNFHVNVFSNGTIIFITGGVLSAKCTTDISKFPFDTQSCSLLFATWNILSTSVKLTPVTKNPVDLSFFTPHSDWNLESYNSSTYDWNGYSTLNINLKIKRQPLYYSLVVIVPTILFGLLNPLVFALPVESGERIGLAMTILLSYAIFLTLVSAAIPASSNPMSIMLIFMIITIAWSGVIVVMAICSSALYYRDRKKEINTFWRCLATKFARNKKSGTVRPSSSEKETQAKGEDLSWKDVSYSLDMLCFVLSVVMLIVLVGIFFIVVNYS